MTKENLKDYRGICAELRRLDDERLKWTSRAESSTRAPSQAPALGGEHDPMPMIIDRLTDLRAEADRLVCRLRDTRARIERAIEKLPADQRRIMRARYIDGKSWIAIGFEMHMDERHARRLHNQALISMKFFHTNRRINKNKRSSKVG